jgi:serine protease
MNQVTWKQALNWLWVVSLLVAASAHARPLGAPFVVNASGPGFQTVIDVAVGANGDTIVLWKDAARGNASFVQRYTSSGQPLQTQDWNLGSDITLGDQYPWLGGRIAADRAGNFVIVRIEANSSGIGMALHATVYDRSGNVRVPQFRVTDPGGTIQKPCVAMNAAGEFVIAWSRADSGPELIYAKRYRANGSALGPAVVVARREHNLRPARVAIDRLGNFAVVWQDVNIANWAWSLWTQRFSSGAIAQGYPLRVTNEGSIGQGQIALDAVGNAVIIWPSRMLNVATGTESWEIYAQRFDPFGTPLGSRFRINATSMNGSGGIPELGVAMTENGGFATAWVGSGGMNTRQFRSDGSPVESADTAIAPSGGNPMIGIDPAGAYTIGWSSAGDVIAQRFVVDTLPPITPMVSGQLIVNLSGASGSFSYYKIVVPPGARTLDVTIQGESGDADLYMRYAALPTMSFWDARPYLYGSNERAIITGVPAGDWYIGVQAYATYAGLRLTASYY